MDKHIKSAMFKINTLTGRQFELYTAYLFKLLGYHHVKVTRATGDYGVDVIATKGKYKYGIQCKKLSENMIGYPAVEEVVCGCVFYHLDKGIVITNQKYTSQAHVGAKRCHVKLLDRKWLKNTIKQLLVNQKPLALKRFNFIHKSKTTIKNLSILHKFKAMHIKPQIKRDIKALKEYYTKGTSIEVVQRKYRLKPDKYVCQGLKALIMCNTPYVIDNDYVYLLLCSKDLMIYIIINIIHYTI